MVEQVEHVCPHCDKELWHGHNAAHGIPETHMAGSERYECRKCNKTWYKREGQKLGFHYILD